ncbi:MAG: hypothetical protein K2N77_04345 [Lachnospiraceae bacterium]|nr:hypothetical protein [Lachnospiraceae bacterium]
MELQPDNPYTNRSYPPPSKPNGDALATAAMILGVLAIILCASFTLYPTFILGSIGIVLALLSRGRALRSAAKAKIGLFCATAGIVFNCLLIATTFQAMRTNPQILEKANELIKEQYGMTYEEMLNAILNGEEIPYPYNFYR